MHWFYNMFFLSVISDNLSYEAKQKNTTTDI